MNSIELGAIAFKLRTSVKKSRRGPIIEKDFDTDDYFDSSIQAGQRLQCFNY